MTIWWRRHRNAYKRKCPKISKAYMRFMRYKGGVIGCVQGGGGLRDAYRGRGVVRGVHRGLELCTGNADIQVGLVIITRSFIQRSIQLISALLADAGIPCCCASCFRTCPCSFTSTPFCSASSALCYASPSALLFFAFTPAVICRPRALWIYIHADPLSSSPSLERSLPSSSSCGPMPHIGRILILRAYSDHQHSNH